MSFYPFFKCACLQQGRTVHCPKQCYKSGGRSSSGWVSDDSSLARSLRTEKSTELSAALCGLSKTVDETKEKLGDVFDV